MWQTEQQLGTKLLTLNIEYNKRQQMHAAHTPEKKTMSHIVLYSAERIFVLISFLGYYALTYMMTHTYM